MAVTPIEARCRRCGEDFHLFELLDDRSGRCPRCGWTLTQDWTHKLLEDAKRADISQRHLVAALRSLQNLPGNITVRPHTVMRNLFEEVGWERDAAADPALLRSEIREFRHYLAEWELLDPEVAEAQPHRGWLRRAIDLIIGRRPEPVLPTTDAGPPADGAANQPTPVGLDHEPQPAAA
jgi:hypothetical protein